MTWGSAWGTAWGTAFGDALGSPATITGSGTAEQPASTSSGSGYIPGAAVIAIAPDRFPGGVPSTQFLKDSASRQGLILAGDGTAEQPAGATLGQAVIPRSAIAGVATAHQAGGDSSGIGRIRRAVLTATCTTAGSGLGSAGQSQAEFIDVELEQFAVTAAIAINEWRRTA